MTVQNLTKMRLHLSLENVHKFFAFTFRINQYASVHYCIQTHERTHINVDEQLSLDEYDHLRYGPRCLCMIVSIKCSFWGWKIGEMDQTH